MLETAKQLCQLFRKQNKLVMECSVKVRQVTDDQAGDVETGKYAVSESTLACYFGIGDLEFVVFGKRLFCLTAYISFLVLFITDTKLIATQIRFDYQSKI